MGIGAYSWGLHSETIYHLTFEIMQISQTPTAHILVRASTNSDYDSCNCAIITISERWKQTQFRRLEAARLFTGDSSFRGLNYHDWSVNFYDTFRLGLPSIDELLGELRWAFVKLDEEELDEESLDEEDRINSGLDCHKLLIGSDGGFKYIVYGEYSHDEFSTKELSLPEILEKL